MTKLLQMKILLPMDNFMSITDEMQLYVPTRQFLVIKEKYKRIYKPSTNQIIVVSRCGK